MPLIFKQARQTGLLSCLGLLRKKEVLTKVLLSLPLAWKQLLKPKICQQVEVEVSQTTPVGLVCQLPNDVNGFIDSSYIGGNIL